MEVERRRADRRKRLRRAGDRAKAAQRRPSGAVKNAVLGLLLIVTLLLIVAAVALEISHLNDTHALKRATSALNSARSAVRQSNSLHSIQARGLAASPYLTCALGDIHQLLMLPQTPSAKREQAAIPARERARELAILTNLNGNLAAYGRIENQQPDARGCPTLTRAQRRRR